MPPGSVQTCVYHQRMLYLASQSPRRRELLAQLGLAHEVVHVEVVELRSPSETPVHYVQRVAREKADAGWGLVVERGDAVVVAADTEVVLGDVVFGKPANIEEARLMLHRLSGRTHQVLSAVCVIDDAGRREALSRSEVSFTTLDQADIEHYVASGEPFGKAGGYAIQGRAAAFVRHLSGSFSGVMGLPLCETANLLGLRHSID